MTRKEQKMKPLFYTMKQVCAMLVLSPERVVTVWIKTGELNVSKTSGDTGHYRIGRDEFDRFYKKHFMPEDTKA